MFGMLFEFFANLEQLEERMHQKISEFGTRTTQDTGYVDEVQRIIGEGQMERNAREVDPFFSAWAENSPTYKAAKGNLPIGVLTGDMLSEHNIMGNVTTSQGQVTVTYGGDAFASQKMRWFAAGGRAVWGLDDVIRARLRDYTKERLGVSLHNNVV